MKMIKKHRNKLILLFSVIIIVVVACNMNSKGVTVNSYIASAGPTAQAYVMDENDQLIEGDAITRGTRVNVMSENSAEYTAIKLDGQEMFIAGENITRDPAAVVLETEVYVRTPVTIYSSAKGAGIAGFAPKGSRLEILKCGKMRKDGSINKYKIKYGEVTGYVYGKYMAFDEESALANCNTNGAYDMAKKATYPKDLHGGKAKNLDYYPCERPDLKDNQFCENARAMYLHAGAVLEDRYFQLAKKNGVNAVVINIDGGTLAYKSPVAKEMCPSAYKAAHYSLEKYQKAVQKYKDAGFYVIGRIVAFNDPRYAKDHKDACIITNGEKTKWVSAYNRGAWEYKVSLAVEAVDLMGFNEIQFDYVRFPEASYSMSTSGKTDWKNLYDESKAQAIQNFCFYAADKLHEAGAYISIDVFGEASYGYVTAYGQYWPAISNVVDAISSMPYTDHHGDIDTWSKPYSTMYNWAKRAARQQKKLATPALARTWITGYNTPHWNPTVTYDYDKLKEQVKALKDAGLDGGFIPWNSSCNFSCYKLYKKIWNE